MLLVFTQQFVLELQCRLTRSFQVRTQAIVIVQVTFNLLNQVVYSNLLRARVGHLFAIRKALPDSRFLSNRFG